MNLSSRRLKESHKEKKSIYVRKRRRRRKRCGKEGKPQKTWDFAVSHPLWRKGEVFPVTR